MMKLGTLQQQLVAALEPQAAAPESPAAIIAAKGGELDGFDVYRRNVHGTLRRTLAATYPACERILGERCFAALARNFAATHPSSNPDLNVYGEGFADFLQPYTVGEHILAELPYLPDLARLEWLWQRAGYAEPAPQFDRSAFAQALQTRPEKLRLLLAPGMALLQSAYPVVELRALNLRPNAALEVEGLDAPVQWCICATARGPAIHTVDWLTYELLSACDRGVSLACLQQAANCDDTAVLEWLAGSVERGWIAGFTTVSPGGSQPC